MKWQFLAMAVLAAACVIGLVQLSLGRADSALGVGVNVFWAIFNLVILSVTVQAVRHRGHRAEEG